MNKPCSVILVGGPEAGKSNYLFRLWMSINKGNAKLRKSTLPDNVEYLEAGVASLMKGEFAGRTEQETPHEIEIPVTWGNGPTVAKGSLIIPDCAGEQWWKVYRRREWSDTWERFVSSASGCLVFVRAVSDKNVPALDWVTCNRYFGTGVLPGGAAAIKDEVPTQVVLVDLIQCLKDAMLDVIPNRRPRIGVVVSAWDSAQREMKKLGPMAFINDNYPLLGQFLGSNSESADFQAFGLSIVDGDLNDERGFRQQYFTREPTEVGSVVWSTSQGVSQSSDITLPVLWAMGIEPLTEAGIA